MTASTPSVSLHRFHCPQPFGNILVSNLTEVMYDVLSPNGGAHGVRFLLTSNPVPDACAFPTSIRFSYKGLLRSRHILSLSPISGLLGHLTYILRSICFRRRYWRASLTCYAWTLGLFVPLSSGHVYQFLQSLLQHLAISLRLALRHFPTGICICLFLPRLWRVAVVQLVEIRKTENEKNTQLYVRTSLADT